MARVEHYYTKFEAGQFYHVYNRSVDKKPMFTQDRNKAFFLTKMDFYLTPYLEIYAYCLMGNHFHLMVRIKDVGTFESLSKLDNPDIHKMVSHAFQKMFQSYAMSFNKQESRVGTLFQTPFKRSLIDSEKYFTQLVYYIHSNPQLHGIMKDFRDYQWSSYKRMLMPTQTKLKKKEILEWFGGIEFYLRYHEGLHDNTDPRIMIDD